MHYLFSMLNTESMRGTVSFSPTDEIWVLPVCCMLCDAQNDSEWNIRYAPDGIGRIPLDKTLRTLGAVNIHYWNYYQAITSSVKKTIATCDWIILPGGRMELGLSRLREAELDKVLASFSGNIVANSAGALILFDKFMVSPNDSYPTFSIENGLSIISADYFLEVHYESCCREQDESIKAALEYRRAVYALSEKGTLVVDDGRIVYSKHCHVFTK